MKNDFARNYPQTTRKKAAIRDAKMNKIDLSPYTEVETKPANLEGLMPGINISVEEYERLKYLASRPQPKPKKAAQRPTAYYAGRPVMVEVLVFIGRGTIEAAKVLLPVVAKIIYYIAYGVAFAVYYIVLGFFDVLRQLAEESRPAKSRQVDKVDNFGASSVYQNIHIGDNANNVTINQQNKM